MFRQTIRKISTVSSRIGNRSYCKKPDPPCKDHKELVPEFKDIGKLKSFELKSDCATFHMKASGNENEKPTGSSQSQIVSNVHQSGRKY